MRPTKTFVWSVLSARGQQQRYYWARNIISLGCGAWAFHALGGGLGFAIALAAMVLAQFTVSPVVAFVLCLIEQMCS
ncbi:MAG: hypothetical protein EON54_09470 [Alcaligenaceae bacterium]|nr:MAG: hypothetical protein EON54_09470 [Alcaligenaceae bacterium]